MALFQNLFTMKPDPTLKPWELRTESEARKEDGKNTIWIFCEDSVCEPIYFRQFGSEKLTVIANGNQKSGLRNVLNAIHAQIDEFSGTFRAKDFGLESNAEIWCVFDLDENPGSKGETKNSLEYNSSIKLAIDSKVNVAHSADSFELWFLLHFSEVGADETNRYGINTRLLEVFSEKTAGKIQTRAIFDSNNDSNNLDAYKKQVKDGSKFFMDILPIFKNSGNLDIAIHRAKELEARYPTDIDYHKMNPYTRVYALVERMIELGGHPFGR